MIVGYYDRDTGKYFTELKSDEFFCPTFDYHRIMERQKQPTVTSLYGLGGGCHKRIFLKYNYPVYYCNKDYFYMQRGTLIHRSLLHNVRYKEFFLGKMCGGIWLSGSADGYDTGGTLYEIKTVGNISKAMRKGEIRKQDIFQQLAYHWLLRANELKSERSKIYYVSYFDYVPIEVDVRELLKASEFGGLSDLVAYIEEKLATFKAIVSGKTKKIDLTECMNCDFWNLCTQGKAKCIDQFRKTGKTPRHHPVWAPGEIEKKMRGDKIYRSKLYVQTLAIVARGIEENHL